VWHTVVSLSVFQLFSSFSARRSEVREEEREREGKPAAREKGGERGSQQRNLAPLHTIKRLLFIKEVILLVTPAIIAEEDF